MQKAQGQLVKNKRLHYCCINVRAEQNLSFIVHLIKHLQCKNDWALRSLIDSLLDRQKRLPAMATGTAFDTPHIRSRTPGE